jgi:hypothetical protein
MCHLRIVSDRESFRLALTKGEVTMAAAKGYTSVVAARTRAAQQILSTPDLLAVFESRGGLKADLDDIVSAGRDAEAFNQAQASTRSDGKQATRAVLGEFADLQRDYVLLLGALRAILGSLKRANLNDPNVSRLADIIDNRASVTVSEVADLAEGATGAKRRVSRSASQEAVRAEIERDLTAVKGFSAIAAALTARTWTAQRIQALLTKTSSLSGKLGDRVAKKGASKAATTSERQAVARQSDTWASTYGLLVAAGRADARIAALLRDARS